MSELKNICAALKRVIISRNKSLFLILLEGIESIFIFAAANLLSVIAYDRKYIKGKQFEHLWSPGWRRVLNGALAKIFLGIGRGIPWPISSQTFCTPNIDFDVDYLDNFWGNGYFQAFGQARISIGKKTQIARGCAIITSNHSLSDPDQHAEAQDVIIGDSCWIASNVVITPGVVLGSHTVVAANAVVTKSFEEGWCVIAGVPAKKIKTIEVGKDSK